jgi:TatD DNase family protein
MPQSLLPDAHCHLDSIPQFQKGGGKDGKAAYDAAFCAGLASKMLLITSGYSHESNIANSVLSQQYKNVYCCLGISPQHAQQYSHESLLHGKWEDFIKKRKGAKLVAIGEVGLDYKWGKTEEEKTRQKACFLRMIGLSSKMGLPLVIHSRDAESACLDTLQSEGAKKFMMHCFGGSAEEAKRAIGLGGIISIPPIRSKERKKVIKEAGIENLVVETDAPYIGKLPTDASKSISMVAEHLGIGEARAAEAALENTKKFFSIG